MEPIDFAHKRRLAEADKQQDAKLITVKDTLLEMIEDIDNGYIDPKMCVLIWCNKDIPMAGWRMSGVNKYEAIGLLAEGQHHLVVSD